MKLYVPQLGDRIQLTTDWEFDLYDEERNFTLMQYLGDTRPPKSRWMADTTAIRATIPAGVILKIDRIYIRKGQEDFSSMTFYWEGARSKTTEAPCPWNPTRMEKKPARAVRFWVKLDDANKIEFDNV